MFDQPDLFAFQEAPALPPPPPPEPEPEPEPTGPQLRPYQVRACDAVDEALSRRKAPVVPVPTGGGKTLIAGELARRHLARHPESRVLVATHRASLVSQQNRHFDALGVGAEIFSAGLGSKAHGRVTLSTVQSMAREAKRDPAALDGVGLIIVDEAHRVPWRVSASGQYRTLLAAVKERNPNCRLAGLTATPFYGEPNFEPNAYCYATSGRGRWEEGLAVAGPVFDLEAGRVSVPELIEAGFLVPWRVATDIADIDVSKVKVSKGEFAVREMDEATLAVGEQLAEDLILACHLEGRYKVIALTAGVDAAREMARLVEERGFETAVVVAETPEDEREAVYDRMRDRNDPLRVLVGVNIVGEGLDIPTADCLALWRATKSPVLYTQAVGRVLRPSRGKRDALVLDHGGNAARFGEDLDAVTPVIKTKRAPAGEGDGEESGSKSRNPWAGVSGLSDTGHPLLPDLRGFQPRRVYVQTRTNQRGGLYVRITVGGLKEGEYGFIRLPFASSKAARYTRRKLRMLGGISDQDCPASCDPGEVEKLRDIVEAQNEVMRCPNVYVRDGNWGPEVVCVEYRGTYYYAEPSDEQKARKRKAYVSAGADVQQSRAAKLIDRMKREQQT